MPPEAEGPQEATDSEEPPSLLLYHLIGWGISVLVAISTTYAILFVVTLFAALLVSVELFVFYIVAVAIVLYIRN